MTSSLRLTAFIAWRFSRGAKQQRFASFVSWFSTLGITLGVAALITVMSVMSGFEGQLKQRILNLVPHLQVSPEAENSVPLASLAASPLISAELVLQSRKGLHAAMLQGIAPSEQVDLVDIQRHMLAGDVKSLQAGRYNVVLGVGVANSLGVHLGDTVRLMATDKVVYTPLGEMPSQRNFTVTGIFEYAAEVDKQFVLANIDDSARLLRSPRTSIEQRRFFLTEPFEIDRLSEQLTVAGIAHQDWRSLYGQFFQAVRMERNMMGLLFCLIVAVAAFNILSSLVMMVGEKRSDVAILQTLGLTRGQVVSVFVIQGAWSGCVGALVGALSGWLLSVNINQVMSALGLNFIANLGGSGLPTVLNPGDIALVTIGAMTLSILATIYPAHRASTVLPAEALRYE